MLKIPNTFRGNAPYVIIAEKRSIVVDRRLHAAEVYLQLDADRMTSDAALFREFASVLRFHSFFGHNWDALAECLGDIGSLIPADRIIVGISHAQALISLPFLPRLIEVLCHGIEQAGSWCNEDGEVYEGPRATLRFVLIADNGSLGRFTDFMNESGADLHDYYGSLLQVDHHRYRDEFEAFSIAPVYRSHF